MYPTLRNRYDRTAGCRTLRPAHVTDTLRWENVENHLMAGRRARLTAVVIAVLVPLAIWTVAEVVFHIRLRTPEGFGPPGDIGALNVIFASAFFSLGGWGLLALLERLTARARTVWMTIAVVTLLLSLMTPLSGTGITPANRAVLELMHLSVGTVLIPALYWTSPPATLATRTH